MSATGCKLDRLIFRTLESVLLNPDASCLEQSEQLYFCLIMQLVVVATIQHARLN